MILEQQVLEKLTSIEKLLLQQNLLKKEVLDLDEACIYMNVSPSYLYKLTSSKSVTHYCPTGKKLFFRRSELDDFILKNRQYSTEETESEAINYLLKNPRSKRGRMNSFLK